MEDERGVALRFNEGKVDWTLLDFKACEPLAQAMMYGATKYTRENWKGHCKDPREHLQSAMRHLIAVIQGEEYDESTVRHTGHVMANMMMYNFHTHKFPATCKESPPEDKRQLKLFQGLGLVTMEPLSTVTK
jgi:hypothetical protein